MDSDRTDEQLLAAARHDGEAFAEFYDRHARGVLAFATTRLGSADLGAEATAETFACALEGLRRFRAEKGSASAWLYGIARHQVARALERGRVERRYRARVGIRDISLDADELDRLDEIVAKEQVSAISPLIAALPTEQRDSLQARVLDERSYDAIAHEMNTTPTTVRKRVSRALALLRERLGATS